MTITIKTAADIEGMRVAGRLASEVLDMLTPHVKPGVTTEQLDQLAHDHIVNVQGAIPAPLNYAPPGYTPYPKSICTSINHQVCHGIPNDRPLKNGDIVNIDVTVIKDGWHGDTSRMFVVGEGSIAAKRLCQLTYEAMWKGIVKVKPGARLGDIGHAIQTFAENARLLGRARVLRPRHRPQASTKSRRCCTTAGPGTLDELVPGMIFTIEPMINAGRREIRETGRRLDHRHQGPLAVGAVGAHGAGHRHRLRGADAVGRQPAAAGLRRAADARTCRSRCAASRSRAVPRAARHGAAQRGRAARALPRRQGGAARALPRVARRPRRPRPG